MPRSGAEARKRLQEAALDLFRMQGYDATTTAQIAEAAGVAERTLFRHFADKREIFFDGEADLRREWLAALAELPHEVAPLPALLFAARRAVPLLRKNRAVVERRRPVIASTPALRERELAKATHLMEALAAALVKRGTPSTRALLAAQLGFAAIARATADWYDQPLDSSAITLEAHLDAAFEEVRELANEITATPGPTPTKPSEKQQQT